MGAAPDPNRREFNGRVIETGSVPSESAIPTMTWDLFCPRQPAEREAAEAARGATSSSWVRPWPNRR
jgi:hypothetical protein